MNTLPIPSWRMNRSLDVKSISLSKESLASKFFWWLYLPFGSVLAIFRLCLLFVGLNLLRLLHIKQCPATNAFVRRVLGIQITYNLNQDAMQKHLAGRIVAVNHISVYDMFVPLNLPQAAVIFAKPKGRVLNFLIQSIVRNMHGITWDVYHKRALIKHYRAWKQQPQKLCLFVAPEKTINNGDGLFAFEADLFARGYEVVPMALKMRLPFGLHPHASYLSYFGRLWRLLSLPFIQIEANALAARPPLKHQFKPDFARSIQTDIARYLGIPATAWRPEDKHSYLQVRKLTKF
ncbi:MAG: hypothetical protein AAF927_25425 [Bacteroidota bacterium]